jgi:hypothetical protein
VKTLGRVAQHLLLIWKGWGMMGARDTLPSHKSVAKLAMVISELQMHPLVGLGVDEFRGSGTYAQFQYALLLLGVGGWVLPDISDEEFHVLTQRTRLLEHETPEKVLSWFCRLLRDEQRLLTHGGGSPLLTAARNGTLHIVTERLRHWPAWK